MTLEQQGLLNMAKESLSAAGLMMQKKFYRFAVPRAYYSMFYCAEALLLAKNLSFSKHSAVIAAFGREFAKAALVPVKFHRFLIEASELREEGDYDYASLISKKECRQHILRAKQFLKMSEKFLRKLS